MTGRRHRRVGRDFCSRGHGEEPMDEEDSRQRHLRVVENDELRRQIQQLHNNLRVLRFSLSKVPILCYKLMRTGTLIFLLCKTRN